MEPAKGPGLPGLPAGRPRPEGANRGGSLDPEGQNLEDAEGVVHLLGSQEGRDHVLTEHQVQVLRAGRHDQGRLLGEDRRPVDAVGDFR